MSEKLTLAAQIQYQKRIMKQFSNFLKYNNITHRHYSKMNTLIIDHGFKTVFKIEENGYWKISRIDNGVLMRNLEFGIYVNSKTELILKCVRFRLIPYGTAKNLKFEK